MKPNVGRGVKQRFGHELSQDQDHRGGDAGLCGQNGDRLRRFLPSRDPKQPVADQRTRFNATNDERKVVANEHGSDEELGPVGEGGHNFASNGGLRVQFGLQSARRHEGHFHS